MSTSMGEHVVGAADGASVHVLEWGSGPTTIVCVHGFGGTAHDWDEVASGLAAEGFHVVAYDQRGHGSSTAGSTGYTHAALVEDLGQVVEWTGAEAPVIVGHSMGSLVTLGYLIEHPGSASAAVLTAAVAHGPHGLGQRMAAGFMASQLGTFVLQRPRLAHRLLGGMVAPGTPTSVVERIRQDFVGCQERHAVDKGFRGIDHTSRLGDLVLAVLVLAGSDDRAVPPPRQRDIADQIVGATFGELADCGHFSPLETPDVLATRIGTWARSVHVAKES